MQDADLSGFVWLPLDTWIVVTGILGGMSCALLGSFLVLRKMSMLGDAISHGVLPGLAAAFLLTGSRESWAMLAGAGLAGLLVALLAQWIHRAGKLEAGAALGVVFTVLFAGGLILIRQSADQVDLDPDCVLYGAIELVPLDQVELGGWQVPRAALFNGAVWLVNLLFVLLLYKELKISAFDPALATTLGINAALMHYLLMTLVAITTVAVFESVGSVLVVAMLIVPPATARLLTDRLPVMLVIGLLLAGLSALVGHVAAITFPTWLGLRGVSTSTAGMMAAVAGLWFALAMLAAPRQGVFTRLLHQGRLALRITGENLLGALYRLQEIDARPSPAGLGTLRAATGTGPGLARLAMWRLRRAGLVAEQGGGYRLTAAGRAAAGNIVRSHRLWETYLGEHLDLPADHLHLPAERLEHVTTAGLQRRLAESVEHPPRDPHGQPIPPADG